MAINFSAGFNSIISHRRLWPTPSTLYSIFNTYPYIF